MSEHDDGSDVRLAGATSVLVLAPAFENPDDEACLDLLTTHPPAETNVLGVTTAAPTERLALWRSGVGDERPARTAVVDASGEGPGTPAEAGEWDASLAVDVLPGDAEPVDVGVAAARRLGAWESTPATTHLCLHSVTALLDAFERERVIALVNALNGQCGAVDAVAHHHLDPDAHDEETVAAFRPLYDAVLEHIPGHGWTTTTADASKDHPSFRAGPDHATGEDATIGTPVTAPIPYSFDTVLELVAAPRRRTLLYHLKDRTDERIPLDDLVERVAERERAIPKREAPSSRDAVCRSLVHTHLPKLAEVGIVAVDADEGVVHYHPNPALESCLEYVETLELG
ncbi:MAG: hypothetical protein ABEJ61_00825 [Haloferacaceae archaeon]